MKPMNTTAGNFPLSKPVLVWLLSIAAHVGFCQELLINEIMSSNATTLQDNDGDFSDWIEIYNASEQILNLEGYQLSDNPSNPSKWVFPRVEISPKGFLLVWASGKDKVVGSSIHTNFSISAAGEEIILSDPQGELLDKLEAIEIPTDISYGRKADGSFDFAFFSRPSPAASNQLGQTTLGLTPQITPSAAPGFYSGEITLNLTATDSETIIYYTLDGYAPTTSSPRWTQTKTLTDRSAADNVYSMIRTTNHGGERGYRSPDGKVRKGTIIRTLAVKPGYEPTEQTFSYFLFPKGPDQYSLPVFSLVTDREHLFSPETGLFVPGNTYDASHPQPHYTGNYFQRGDEWERPANISYFEKSGGLGFQDQVGIRIHGGVTRHFPLKALRVYLRPSYGNSSLDYPLFSERSYRDARRFILRGSGNDYGDTYFRDAFAQQLVSHLDLDYQAYEPSILFVNGEYWGIHNIRERQDKHYLHNLYGVDPENLDILTRRNTPEEGDAKQYDFAIQRLSQLDPTNPASFEEIETYFDLDNHIDYMITQIYVANTDWPHNNIDFWRERVNYSPELPKGRDGRFRWILYDTDFGLGHVNNADHNSIKWVTSRTGQGGQEWPNLVFRKLLEYPTYRDRFISRFLDQLNTTFQPQRASALLAELKERIAPEMEEHIKRWRQPSSMAVWHDRVSHMDRFVQDRQHFVRAHLKDHFQLKNDINLRLDVSDPAAGFIQVNNTMIHPSTTGVSGFTYPWFGHYFEGIPLRLSAEPSPGYLFDHWLVNGQRREDLELHLMLDDDADIQAMFVQDPDESLSVVHYWFFDTGIENDIPLTMLPSSYSATESQGLLHYLPAPTNSTSPGIMDRVNDPTQINLDGNLLDELGLDASSMRGIRVRNPLEIDGQKGYLLLNLPMTGFKEPKLSAAVSRTSNGPRMLSLSYRTHETEDWIQTGLSVTEFELETEYTLLEVRLEGQTGIAHNSNFQLRIDFSDNTENNSGNVRFNNISLEAFPLIGADLVTRIPINKREQHEIFIEKIYPNPASERVTIDLSTHKLHEIIEIRVLDATGTEITSITEIHSGNLSLETVNWAPGLYLVQVLGRNLTESHKIIRR
ncbi:hypothetical protein ADIS_1180 [Lunatimonas lonarensis]|uniref:LTD domain-containing protein n=1 Tax=Lunatimonas lonarensis TaxID=1232681 RepID=R7ZW53_9BACT|nr:CotH kinase family protein [Lunatimonas lonarensis]EON78317.1 hypothetical protein ADIS_1180 [Lunatimonas lonarensis]